MRTRTAIAARLILRADGLFLFGVGGLAMMLEAIGHFSGRGPLGHLAQSPYTIGGFEAHGLAALLGLQLLLHAGDAQRRSWHALGIAIHLLLGGANLAFWVSFTAFDMLPVGVVTTALHFFFAAAHAACIGVSGWRPDAAPTRSATRPATTLLR